MSTTTRRPTEIAPCGCRYDPEYDEGHVGWHLATNPVHIRESIDSIIEDLGRLRDAVALLEAEHERPER